MDRIDTLLFDFGGTLDLPGEHWLDRFLVHYRAAGWRLERQELDPAFAWATAQGYRATQALRECDLSSLVERLVQWHIEELRERLPARFPAGFVPSQIAVPFCHASVAGMLTSRLLLAELAPRFHLGVVSNFYGNLERVLADAGILELTTTVIDSSQVGVFKPDPYIFALALQALGARAEHTLMIGDSLTKDCAPARALGMKTALVTGARSACAAAATGADYVIADLADLHSLLGD
ncbi:MAG TPA: HAD family hydrolase [Candidatus Binataceae bacterium]|nr:HAD family hydrolase [Candidatus Binataceae bacterium]